MVNVTHIRFQCFRCDHSEVKRLDQIKFDHLRDYRCPNCGRAGCTHILRVLTDKSEGPTDHAKS